jgi:hypothetical protein
LQNYELPALPATNAANDYGTYQGSAANHGYVIEDVIRAVQQSAQKTNVRDGVKVVEIIERIYALRPEVFR